MIKKENRANVTKAEEQTNLVKISDYYPDNCSEQEYLGVSNEVLEYLMEKKREEKKMEMRDYRHLAAFGFDEMQMAEMCGIYTPSVEETLISKMESESLREAMESLKPTSRRRFCLYYGRGLTLKQIADMEGVSDTAIRKTLKAAVVTLRKVLLDNNK